MSRSAASTPLNHSASRFAATHWLAALLLGSTLAVSGCGGGGGGGGGGGTTVPTGTSTVLDYSKFRDFSSFVNGDPRPILAEDGSGFDADEVDGPAVAVDKSRPNGDFFMMFYEAVDGVGNISIGLVTSSEEDFQTPGGVTVISRQQVISAADDPGLNAFNVHATDPTVIVDRRAATPAGARYKMWFEGRSGAGGTNSSIVYCESGDGINWTNFTVCTGLAPSTNVSFGSRVADPTVLLDQNAGGDTFRMWFEAVNETGDGSARIGYADSANGTAWTVRDASGATGSAAGAVISPGFGGPFTNYTVASPSVVLLEDGSDNNLRFYMWYTAGDVIPSSGTEDTIGYATSTNGLTWLKEGTTAAFNLPVLQPTSDSVLDPTTSSFEWDSGDVRQPCGYIDDNGTPGTTADDAYHLWFAADIENGGANSPNRIGYAKDLP